MPSFDSRDLVDKLIASAEPKLRRRIAEIILLLRSEHTLDELAELIAVGRAGDALALVTAAGARLAAAVNVVFLAAGEATSTAMGKALSILVDFDQTNLRAVAAMQRNRLDLIRDFTIKQTAATQQALLEGIQGGLNPRETARLFRDSIGLTPRQQAAVSNFRRLLQDRSAEALTRELRDRRFDPTVARAVALDEPLTAAQIDAMVARYSERYVKYRAEVIARTEAGAAAHEGVEEAFAQAIDAGNFTQEEVRRTWNTADDSRVRDFSTSATSHRTMHHQVRRLGEPFVSGAGNKIRFPCAPEAPAVDRIQCRCRVAVRVELPELAAA